MPHDVSIDHSVGCRGRLLHTDRGQVEEFREDLRRDRFDLLPLVLGYTVMIYWLFRGKVAEGESYH